MNIQERIAKLIAQTDEGLLEALFRAGLFHDLLFYDPQVGTTRIVQRAPFRELLGLEGLAVPERLVIEADYDRPLDQLIEMGYFDEIYPLTEGSDVLRRVSETCTAEGVVQKLEFDLYQAPPEAKNLEEIIHGLRTDDTVEDDPDSFWEPATAQHLLVLEEKFPFVREESIVALGSIVGYLSYEAAVSVTYTGHYPPTRHLGLSKFTTREGAWNKGTRFLRVRPA